MSNASSSPESSRIDPGTVFLRALFVLTFITLLPMILIPSYEELKKNYKKKLTPPTAPPLSNLPDDKESRDAWLKAYTQQVAAFKSEVDLYKARVEATKTPKELTRYEKVVTNTLTKIFTTLITGMIGYAFVRGGTQLLANRYRMQQGHKPEKITFF